MINESIKNDIITLLEECQFRELCDKYFSSKFHWVIKGTSILSGDYTDKDAFFENVIGRLSACLEDGWEMHILATYNTDNAVIVEMRGEVKTKTGEDYNNEYCWIFHFENDKVVKLTAYYDSLLLNQTLIENEN